MKYVDLFESTNLGDVLEVHIAVSMQMQIGYFHSAIGKRM